MPRRPVLLHPTAALWERRLQDREPLQYLTACAYWRDVVLSGATGRPLCTLRMRAGVY